MPDGLAATNVIVAAVFGYLLGSVPFGYLAGKTRGVDIRRHGSGVIGATNTLRVLGPGFAIAVALLDASKGLLSAFVGRWLIGDPAWGATIGGAAAVAGHSWSIFLGFGGGKSVAASFGVVVFFMPQLALFAVIAFILLIVSTRYVSLGSLGGVIVAAVLGLVRPGLSLAYRFFLVYAAVLIIYRHQANIRRLLAGTESKFGQRVSSRSSDKGGPPRAKGGSESD